MIKRKCKITYICHGATIYSESDRLCDKLDYPPLTEIGKNEIAIASQWIKRRGIMVDKIFCSPEIRTEQSARILAEVCKVDFTILDNLYSRRSGTWSGLSYEQIEKKYPKELEAYHNDRANFVMPNGESLNQFNERVNNIIQKLVEENNSTRLIVVTNKDVIQSAIGQALSIPANYQTRIYIPTGSATQISYYKDWAELIYSGLVDD